MVVTAFRDARTTLYTVSSRMECPLLLTFDEPIEVLDEASLPIIRNQQDFLKSLLFSSDGSAVLASTESKQALIYRIDDASLQKHQYYVSQDSSSSTVCPQDDNLNASSCSSSIAACPFLSLEKTILIGESIYDLKWSPNSNTTSQRFLATSSDHPIQLWDVETASVSCSYNAYNHLDELDTAVSLALNATSDRVYGGYNRMIRAFDLEHPGKQCAQQMPTSESRRSPHGQKGIVSALAFNPDFSGTYAAGSFAHSVGIYAENTVHPIMLLDADCGGVTCLRWSPCGHYLWVGGRNSCRITCWDIRTTQSMLGEVQRACLTNQRMTFDLDPWGKYLCTGDQGGGILLYDAVSFALVRSWCPPPGGAAPGHSCINSTMFHPFSAIIGAAAGERVFPPLSMSNDSDSSSDESISQESKAPQSIDDVQCPKRRRRSTTAAENSSRLFLLGLQRTPIPYPE